jgi:alkylation response protein AidB-like acyl-CoA dehydrogenase
VSLSSGGALWGMGPTGADLIDLVRAAGGVTDPILRQRVARLHTTEELLRLIRLRTVSARIRGAQPGPEASIRKVMADEHGQAIMGLAKDLAGAGGMLAGVGPLGTDPGVWAYGFLFAPALTVGGGTGEVQRNILGERVLGLPHDVDVEAGQTWSESRPG